MSEPKWVSTAKKYIGLKEIPGPKTASQISKWLDALKAPFRDDETAWCGTFVGGVMQEAGFPIIKNPWGARNWLTFGAKLAGPAVGAIVVFWRGQPSGWSGHVGVVVGKDKANNLMVLGGNQGDMVCIKPFATARVLAYQWPAGQAQPQTGFSALPIIASDGRLSTDEA